MKVAPTTPKLRFPTFDGDWKDEKFGKIASIRSASRVHKDEWTEQGVPFFRSSDVVSHYKGAENKKAYISSELFDDLSAKSGKIKKHDLLVTGGGSIGIPYLVPNDAPLYFKDADLLWFKKSENIHSYYLYTYFSTAIFRRYLASVTHIGTIAHYTIEQAKATPITLPSLPEQRKIADFLTAVDGRIGQLIQKKALLEDYKKGVMQQLFTQAIRFKDDHGNDFPDWEEKKLGDIAQKKSSSITAGSLAEMAGDYPVYGAAGEMSSIDTFAEDREYIGIVKDGAGVGRTMLCKPYTSVLGTMDIVKAKPGNHLRFLFGFLNLLNFNKHVTGSTIPHIYFKDYSRERVGVPKIEEQTKIADFLSAIDRKIESVATQITETQTFKRGLLQQMFV